MVRDEKAILSMKEFTAKIVKDEREFYLRKRSEPEDAQTLKDYGISKRFFHKITSFMDFQKIKDKQAEEKTKELASLPLS